MPILPAQSIVVDSPPVEEKKGNHMAALVTLGVLYFMMGFITCLNDTLVPFFKTGFTLSYSQSSLVQFCFFIIYAIMSIPSGKIVEWIGYKKGMVYGFLIAAAGALLFYPASSIHRYELFLVALFILALVIVLLQVAANPYITILGPAKSASSRLALILGVGSIGTTITPLFGAHFILTPVLATSGSEAARVPDLFIGAGLILIALLVSCLSLPSLNLRGEATGEASRTSIFSSWKLGFWSMVAVGLCNSIMFAVIFSLSITGLGKYTSQASGILTTAIAGGAIISFLQGILKDNYSWKIASLIPLVCYCYITFYAYTNLKPNDNI